MRTQTEIELDPECMKKLGYRLEVKINRVKAYIDVIEKGIEGDNEAGEGDKLSIKAGETENNREKIALLTEAKGHYNNSIEIYEDVKKMSEDIPYYDMIKEMEEKIKEVKEKIKNSDGAAKAAGAAAAQEDKAKENEKKAEDYKKSGDKKYKSKQYEEAKIDYRYALDFYKELNDKYDKDTTEKRSEIERIMLDIDKKLQEEQKVQQQ